MNFGLLFDGALTMKPSLVLSREVNERHGSDRAYLAGEHGFDLSSHLTGRRGLLTRPSLLFVPTTKPSKPSTRMSPSLAAFSWIRYRVCALAASVLPLRTCQERTAILIGRRQHRTVPWTGRAPALPSLQSMPGASPRATASIRTDVDADDSSGAAKLFLCKARTSPKCNRCRLAVSDSRGYRSRAHRS